jgi:hypothetical protein
MGQSRIGLALVAAGLWIAPAFAQTIQVPPRCLHGDNETQVQAARRGDALEAADLINRALDRHPRDSAYPSWEALAMSQAVSTFRGFAGQRGNLARKMEWGRDEPLPGWRIHYVAGQEAYAFSLSDLRDPCQFTVSSNDTGVIIEGRRADWRRQVRVIPLDSTH